MATLSHYKHTHKYMFHVHTQIQKGLIWAFLGGMEWQS